MRRLTTVMPHLYDILLVAAGGALGAVTRFLVQQCALAPHEKYVHTLGVNITGCIAIGVVWALLMHFNAPQWMHRLLIAGFLGGYTTFSAFALDSMQLLQAGRIITAMTYMTLSVAGGLAACICAYYFTKQIL